MLEAATTAEKMLTPLITGLVVGLGTIITEFRNHRKAKTGKSALERIETKIDGNHVEMRETCRLLAAHIDEVDETATIALHHVVGPDGENGVRSRVDNLEKWQEAETLRERDRLQRIADGLDENRVGPPDRRGLDPSQVGAFYPRPA